MIIDGVIQMEFEEVLKARKSIRAYKPECIDREIINQIIEAAIYAPSWKNSQTARYHIVQDKELLEKIKVECLPSFNQENCKDAPILIVTTFVIQRAGFERDGNPSNELADGWGCYDLGLHNQTALLKAAELGISSLVMGIRNASRIRQLLQIEERECIVSIVALGFSDSDPDRPKRKKVAEIAKFY